jgi:hypothetical protein
MSAKVFLLPYLQIISGVTSMKIMSKSPRILPKEREVSFDM